MDLAESYIVDAAGNIKSVILDYYRFKKFENLILDLGLAKAMEEVENEEEYDLDEAKKIAGFTNGS